MPRIPRVLAQHRYSGFGFSNQQVFRVVRTMYPSGQLENLALLERLVDGMGAEVWLPVHMPTMKDASEAQRNAFQALLYIVHESVPVDPNELPAWWWVNPHRDGPPTECEVLSAYLVRTEAQWGECGKPDRQMTPEDLAMPPGAVWDAQAARWRA